MIAQSLKRLGKHSLIYGVGTAVNGLAGFFLIPLYTHALSTSDYGVLELVNRTSEIIILIVVIGLNQAFLRFYFDKKDHEWQNAVISTVLIYVGAASIVFVLLLSPFCGFFSKMLLKDSRYSLYFTLMLLWFPFEISFNFYMTYLQIRTKSLYYILMNFLRLGLLISSNIYLLLYLHWGIKGVLLTSLLVNIVFGAPMFVTLLKNAGVRFSRPILKEMFKFSLPLVPGYFIFFILNSADRYLLSLFWSPSEVGIYALGYKIGMISTVLISEPFRKIWAPFLFENMDTQGSAMLFGRIQTYYVFVTLVGGLIVAVNAGPILNVISPSSFHEAAKIVPIIAMAYICWGSNMIFESGIFIKKRMDVKFYIVLISAAINVLCNLTLIPLYGALGAAWAMLAGFLVFPVSSYVVSQKYYFIQYEFGRIFRMLLAGVITFSLCGLFKAVNQSIILLEIVLVVTFGVSLLLFRFFSVEEINMVKSVLLKKRGVV